MNEITKHFVTFYSPGTIVAETTKQEIGEWDTREAVRRASKITERHGAKPYGFQFTTLVGGGDRFTPEQTAKSGMHYINATVETLAEIDARNDPREQILRANMHGNGWDKLVTTANGYRWAQPFEDGDVCVNADGETVTT